MQNLDIYVLTTIVVTLFIVFFITIWREFISMDNKHYSISNIEGPRGQMVNFIGKLLEDKSIETYDKKIIVKAMNRTIADMESDGIYFSDDVKQELEKKRDELYCEYSNLPSVKSYE